MFRRLSILTLFAALNISAADQQWLLRWREYELAKALAARNETAVSKILDNNFHVDLQEGNIIRTASAAVDREGWLAAMAHPGNGSYEAKILKVNVVRSDQAFVTIAETWTDRSPRGRLLRTSFVSEDYWQKLDGIWKLTERISHSDSP